MSLVRMRSKLKESGKHGSAWLLGLLMAVVITSYFGIGGGGGRSRSQEEKDRDTAVRERDQPVATVGTVEITRAQMEDALNRTPIGQQATTLQRHSYYPLVLNSLVDQAILTNAAHDKNISVDSGEVKAEIEKRVAAEAQATGVNALTSDEQKRQFTNQIRLGIDKDAVRRELTVQKLADELKKNVTLETKGLKPDEIEVGARHILITYKGAPAFKGRPTPPKPRGRRSRPGRKPWS